MVFSFTKMIKGMVLREKRDESVLSGLHEGWCLNFNYPTVGYYQDNRGEFKTYMIKEIVNKLFIYLLH